MPFFRRAALLSVLLGSTLAVSPEVPPLVTVLTAQPGLSPREVVINVKITNPGLSAVELLWSRRAQQDCVPSLWLRVLRAGSHEVVYPDPSAPARLAMCTQDVRVQTLQTGQTVHHGRHLTLPAGRYAVEVTLPGNSVTRGPLPVGYVVVDVR